MVIIQEWIQYPYESILDYKIYFILIYIYIYLYILYLYISKIKLFYIFVIIKEMYLYNLLNSFSNTHVYFKDFNINLLKYFIKMKWIPGKHVNNLSSNSREKLDIHMVTYHFQHFYLIFQGILFLIIL